MLATRAMLVLGMTVEDRRERERDARRRLILSTARALAEAEGWQAVTTRRLSSEIEYSQPVLYKHFSGLDQIAEALAIDGFGELADMLHSARVGAGTAEGSLAAIAHAYVDFAGANPALYEAMFTRATTLRFAAGDTPAPLTAAFSEIREAVSGVGAHDGDVDTATEVFWTALHGLITLARADRLRVGHDSDRIELLVSRFAGVR
jgi:AcrR family transcriptional regulator